jgi:hypothetical protein
VSLPPAVARMALLRMDAVKRAGRERCRRNVNDELARHFASGRVVERTADAIWSRLVPELGGRLGDAQPGSENV